MEYSAQFTYDCLWRVDGEKRVCTGGHESDGYPWSVYLYVISLVDKQIHVALPCKYLINLRHKYLINWRHKLIPEL